MLDDEWILDDTAIVMSRLLPRIKELIEDESDVIVEHRLYKAAHAPIRLVFGDFETFEKYVLEKARPGDALLVWKFEDCCKDDGAVVSGKIPNERGQVPRGGRS